jgi:hypothetical protein
LVFAVTSKLTAIASPTAITSATVNPAAGAAPRREAGQRRRPGTVPTVNPAAGAAVAERATSCSTAGSRKERPDRRPHAALPSNAVAGPGGRCRRLPGRPSRAAEAATKSLNDNTGSWTMRGHHDDGTGQDEAGDSDERHAGRGKPAPGL